MTNLENRILAFHKLGQFINNYINADELQRHSHPLDGAIQTAFFENGWFAKNEVLRALSAWAKLLTETQLNAWMNSYLEKYIEPKAPKKVLVIMAGNIPLVGFHDALAVLLTGNVLIAKLSSDDTVLMKLLLNQLMHFEPRFEPQIRFQNELVKDFDAVIATGSNNSANYFNYYFGKYPNIIRKNRKSVAIITEETTNGELKQLGKDIFYFYGLGCRNVSKIYLPKGFDLNRFFENIIDYAWVIENKKYFNNYEYNKTLYLLNNDKILDNNFVILRESNELAAPIGVVFYQYYNHIYEANNQIEENKDLLQCAVNKDISFGMAQFPSLNDYADGVDTINFLLSLNKF